MGKIHKINWIGNSGVVFMECGEVSSSIAYIRATKIDKEVTCGKCLAKIANQQLQPTEERGS